MELKLWPPPQDICHHPEIAPFTWNYASNIIIWQAPNPPPDGANELAAQTGLKLQYKPDKHCHFSNGSQPASRAPRLPYLGSQGYFLNIATDQIQGQANSETGLFYALITLLTIRRRYPQKVPAATIHDRPNCEHRGIMIDLARVVESPAFIISLLPLLAECKLNCLYLYLENKLQFKSHPELAHPCAWSADDARELVVQAQRYAIDIIPMPATVGHMEAILKHPAYNHLAVSGTGDHLETANPAAREFLRSIIDELCSLFPAPYMHLAGDECPYLGNDKAENIRKYADIINFMADCLRRHGRRGIIWGDMVEKYPELKSQLADDLILTVWKYGPLDDMEMPLPEEFVKAGFDTALAPAILADEPFLPSVARLTRNIPYLLRRSGMWGVITCLWEPRTQNLPVAKIGMAIAGAYSWMPFFSPHNAISQASRFVYGYDIADVYKLLDSHEFFDMMVSSCFGYYHSFELTCNSPLLHLKRQPDDTWRKLRDKVRHGYELLEKQTGFHRQHPDDYTAFEACATLALLLADMVVSMTEVGQMINDGATTTEFHEAATKLRRLAEFTQKTLTIQCQAWNHCRKPEDQNFQWWFTDPLNCKITCLKRFASELESMNFAPEHRFFVFQFHKGDAPAFNLWRIKILFSDDGILWKQVFFRTIPLWMSDGLTLEFMPEEGRLPRMVRIEPCYATWNPPGNDWRNMLKIGIGTLSTQAGKLYADSEPQAAETWYEVDYAADGINLKHHMR